MDKRRPGVKKREKSIQIWFNFNGKRCWETIKCYPSETNLDNAARLRRRIAQEIDLGVFDYKSHFPKSKNLPPEQETPPVPTFYDACVSYLNGFKDESTRRGYKNALNRTWAPLFPMPVDSITYHQIHDCKSTLSAKSGKYIHNELIPLRGVFKLMKKMKHLKDNPCDDIESVKKGGPRPDPFSREEAEKIISFMHTQYGEIYGCYFETAFYTGMRSPSELIALPWRNIDIEKRIARVSQRKNMGILKKGTKTVESRDVYLLDRPLAAIRKMRGNHPEFVFINPRTKKDFRDGQRLNHVWKTCLATLRLRHRKMYNTRHTCATMMLEEEVNPAVAALQLGHSLKMFFEVYAKWINATKMVQELEKVNKSVAKSVAKSQQ